MKFENLNSRGLAFRKVEFTREVELHSVGRRAVKILDKGYEVQSASKVISSSPCDLSFLKPDTAQAGSFSKSSTSTMF